MKVTAAPAENGIEDATSAPWERFPKTRFLGSKRKLLGALAKVFSGLEFETALDPFSGTGSVAYLLKALGKAVTAQDVLNSNVVAARALIENSTGHLGALTEELIASLPDPRAEIGFVERTFGGIFFEPEENRFIDGILPRIDEQRGFVRDLSLWALFQACLAKRPYNLFHRANLNMRRRDVARSFGNKTTWERPFAELIRKFAAEADSAVFDSGLRCQARKADALQSDPAGFDLVYLDPPYVSARGAGVDYLDYYHFLEGLCAPSTWAERIQHQYKHKPLSGRGQNPWAHPERVVEIFERTIEHFCQAILVISYRSDGIPSIEQIVSFLKKAAKKVEVIDAGRYTYALSRNNRSREFILIGAG